jgi:hypothetical protein
MQEDKGQLTSAQAIQLNDNQRLQYLKEQWGMPDLCVRGRLRQTNELWWLTDVRSEDGSRLRYPLKDLDLPLGSGRPGVFLGNESSIASDLREPNMHVSVQLELAYESERSKQGNPLLVAADPESLERITFISPERLFHNEDGSIAIAESVRQDYVAQCRAHADAELAQLTAETARLTEDANALSNDLDEIKQQHRQTQEALEEADAQYLLVKQETQAIEEELAAARKKRDRELGEIRSQTDGLRSYVKAQVEPLRRLELITDVQWKALFPDAGKTADRAPEGWPVFDGETTQAIDHIQRYLFGKEVGYPWDLLANFHALLCTGDLIVLSGLSGSGKTNLVKSYADATGNEARIVPVKPNWTSAEDLLGFHNPLQRAYATTPFIEALFEASRDPERLYLICLDEMNLARVEYYFADFLSRLEDRRAPTIELYPDDEAGHVMTELRVLMQTLTGLALDLGSANLATLLADGPTMAQLAERLGLGDGESFAQMHARVRRMLSGALTVPARLPIPANVRFVGAINMDDTTHYLSPKVLDRAHVLQFQSPLDYWELVSKEVGEADPPTHGIRIPAGAFPPRGEYPPYRRDDPIAAKLNEYRESFLAPLGIELGMRPLRQAIHYRDRLADVFEGEGLDLLALNNFLRQKVFPRFSFDGKQSARGRGEQNRDAVARQFRDRLVPDLAGLTSPDGALPFRASDDLAAMIERANANDGVYNYWA